MTGAVLCALLLLAMLLALAAGDQPVPPVDVLRALAGAEVSQVSETIVMTLRLPRVALAAAVGAALAVAGTATQAVLRNPLAEPGLLGINAGAALAAMIVIVEVASLPESVLPAVSFAGALITALAIQMFAWRAGTSSLRLILVGVGVGALAGAGASFIAAFGPAAEVQRAITWSAGSLQDARWVKLEWLVLWGLPGALALWLAARELDLIALGDRVAGGVGQRVQLVRGLVIVAVALLAGAAVAASGPIAFVGLAAPHVARALTGRNHARLIPVAAVCGAILLVVADLAARRLLAPVQVPVGLATALIGAPFFGYLLWSRRNEL
jgi:iron complex transport system permease protein